MRHRTPLTRALCLLLAVTALLPAFARAGIPGCAQAAPVMAAGDGCCCAQPVAPPCHAAPAKGPAAKACGCGSQPTPTAPADRGPAAAQELAALAALSSQSDVLALPPTWTGPATEPAAVPRAGGSALLRLHCVILI